MPIFYKQRPLISAGIQLLMRKGIIYQNSYNGNDYYAASRDTIDAINNEKENQRLNKEIDLKIKGYTLEQLKAQRWPQKYWYLVAIITAIIGALISKLF